MVDCRNCINHVKGEGDCLEGFSRQERDNYEYVRFGQDIKCYGYKLKTMNKREQARQSLISAEKEVKKARELIESLEKEILVPDCIKIEKESGGGDGLSIAFADNESILAFSMGYKPYYRVNTSDSLDFIPCKLIPCTWEEIEVGGTGFRSDLDEPNFKGVCMYFKKIESDKLAFVDSSGSTNIADGVDNSVWDNWFKVVPK